MPVTIVEDTNISLNNEMKKFGCPDLIHLGSTATSVHLDYLDLIREKDSDRLMPDAVAEFQGRPTLYVLDRTSGDSKVENPDATILDLQQLLANRSEHACLGVIRPGELTIYPINLSREELGRADFTLIKQNAPEAPLFFQSLATGALKIAGQPKTADYVFDEIHNLLSKASEALTGQIRPLEVLSVTGRALFFRFLIDRRIVLPSELKEICPLANDLKGVFSNPEWAAHTSCWLDETFNGDLLPLVPELALDASKETRFAAYLNFYNRVGAATDQNVFRHLEAILRGWRSLGNSLFQPTIFNDEIDWGDLNFAYIPIGVLSQVYETFSRQWDESHAMQTGVYYTPKNIAQLVVEEALAGVDNPADACVLDPACGAGVFLVLAFRHLVQKRWKKDGKRPDTATIQQILYNQIYGFDVSESALRLAALALYITAIEVNGTTRPPKSLKFPQPLQNKALLNFGVSGDERKRAFEIGSLGTKVPESFNGKFDVVIGNPPWTSLGTSTVEEEEKVEQKKYNKALNRQFTAITRRVLSQRAEGSPILRQLSTSYTNPDNNPDLPFIWRSAEWAKPNGVIAMALPARIILKQNGKGKIARDAILQGLTITGIINGSDVEETSVWPNMKLPFMLLFARNTTPRADYPFIFATPVRENRLCDRGEFRLDYQAAEPVAVGDIINNSWILKTLAVGTSLDVPIIEKLKSEGWARLSEIWKPPVLNSGDGYHILPATPNKPADDLFDLQDFEAPPAGFRLELEKMKTWREVHKRTTAHAPRTKDLFSAPLLIIPQTPGLGRERPKSFISYSTALSFRQGNYGYSATGHPKGEILISLLYLITHSLLFQYFCLMVSSRIGASWRTFIKEDLDEFPFPSPDQITNSESHLIVRLASALQNSSIKPWDEIDDFIFRFFGLDEYEAVVVRDTVSYCAPYRPVRLRAESPPNQIDAETFRDLLEEMLQPYFAVVGQQINVTILPRVAGMIYQPWKFLTICFQGNDYLASSDLLVRLMEEANNSAASRVVLHLSDGGLLIGLLNQQRFWTRSRARLCSLHIIREHLSAFALPK